MPTLLLDCDGVIADTEKFGHFPAFNQAFADSGIDVEWQLDEYSDLVKISGGKERIQHYFADHPDLVEGQNIEELAGSLHRLKTQLYVEMINGGTIPARPGIKRLVTEAKAKRWTVAVASTSALASVEAVVANALPGCGVEDIYAGDMVSQKKPSPEIYLLAMKGVAADPHNTIVIEDSEAGATAAYRANLPHIVTHSALTEEEAFPHAELILSDLGEPGQTAEIRGGKNPQTDEGMVTVALLESMIADYNANKSA